MNLLTGRITQSLHNTLLCIGGESTFTQIINNLLLHGSELYEDIWVFQKPSQTTNPGQHDGFTNVPHHGEIAASLSLHIAWRILVAWGMRAGHNRCFQTAQAPCRCRCVWLLEATNLKDFAGF